MNPPESGSPAYTLALPCILPGRSLPLVANARSKCTTYAHQQTTAGAPLPPHPRASRWSGLPRLFRFALSRVLALLGLRNDARRAVAFGLYSGGGRQARGSGLSSHACRAGRSPCSRPTRHATAYRPAAPSLPPSMVSARGFAPSGLFCRLALTDAPCLCAPCSVRSCRRCRSPEHRSTVKSFRAAARFITLAAASSRPAGFAAACRGLLRAGPRLPALVLVGGPRLPSSSSPLPMVAPSVVASGYGRAVGGLRPRFFVGCRHGERLRGLRPAQGAARIVGRGDALTFAPASGASHGRPALTPAGSCVGRSVRRPPAFNGSSVAGALIRFRFWVSRSLRAPAGPRDAQRLQRPPLYAAALA